MHIDEDKNCDFDLKNELQSDDCELDRAETINIHKAIDSELRGRISGIFIIFLL